MHLDEFFLWLFIGIVFYAYFGYGLLLWTFLKVRRWLWPHKRLAITEYFPPLTLVIPSYNEEGFIEQKIKNTLSLDYPKDRLNIVFITDGSTDRTPAIIQQYPQFTLLHQGERRGKPAAMNRAMQVVKTPIVVFCDANTRLNESALKEIAKHYSDDSIGGVTGEKKVVNTQQENGAGRGESLYWRYESFLKKMDSDFYTVVGAAGELFSFRTQLYDNIEEDTLLDDFMISLRICRKGYRVAYEAKAYAVESPSSNIKEEQKRKIRISAGAFQSMLRLKGLLNFIKYPQLSFQYISHRVLRWAICPFILPMILLLNLVILYREHLLLYQYLLAAQTMFYLFALTGWYASKLGRRLPLVHFPYYFMFMNLSLYLGLLRFLSRKQSILWEKAKRQH